MSRKKVKFTVLSEKRCKVCGSKLKQNLVDHKPKADMCYGHYQMLIKGNHNYPLDDAAKRYQKGLKS